MLSKPRIVCAAMRFPNGVILPSARHYDKLVHANMKAMDLTKFDHPEQGFIDQHCRFWDRKSAYVIAEYNGQIIRQCECGTPGVLYSEHLY